MRFVRDAQQLLQDMEVEAAHSSGLLPGVLELLAALRQENIGVGIVTRNCDAAVRVTFPHLDVYCQAFIPRDRVTQVKPHPAHLQAALDCLGTPPARAIMVGDGAMDIQAGKALGMFSVGVLSGSSSTAKLLAQGAELLGQEAPTDPRVLIGPRVGEDAAVIDMGDRLLIAKSDPITFATDAIGHYAVTVNANDIAVMGGTPRWFLATLLLPEVSTTEALVRDIFAQLRRACGELGIALV